MKTRAITIPVTITIDTDALESDIIGTVQEERIRHIVREELSNWLPDIKRMLREGVTEHLASEIRKRGNVRSRKSGGGA